MMIELKPGDCVITDGITEREYNAIAKAFEKSGCTGEPAPWDFCSPTMKVFGWSTWFNTFGWSSNDDCKSFTGRQLTPAQILATPQWVPEVGGRVEVKLSGDHWEPCEIAFVGSRLAVFVTDADGEQVLPFTASRFRPLRTEEDRAVEEMMQDAGLMRVQAERAYRASYRKQPQPAEDMSDPANWRAGDVLSSKIKRTDITCGKEYEAVDINDDTVHIYDDVGDYRHRDVKDFRFVHRP